MRSDVALSTGGKVYVYALFTLGTAAILQAAHDLWINPAGFKWLLLAALTLISGSATVRLPSVPATISVSETFVITSVLLFGPSAGTLTVALDSLVMSFWVSRRHFNALRLLFNLSAPALSIWIASRLLFFTSGIAPLADHPVDIGDLVGPLILFAASYFVLNSGFTAIAISLETSDSPISIWKTNFAWLSLNFFGGASLAALMAVYTRDIDLTYLGIILPLLLVMHLTFKTSMARVEDANRHLEELNALYVSTVETLAMAIDAKDQITHGHVRRVQFYATALARAVGIRADRELRAIEAAALLHDMGKLAIPEYILNKPDKLTPGEFEKMKRHASIGADILSSINFPYPVVPIVRHHHENWDGSGYPDGLRGPAIPVGARILAVVDCFDALTSDRPYRPKLADAEAMAILIGRSGTMYDPEKVDTFVAIYKTLASGVPDAPGERGIEAITAGQLELPDKKLTSLEDIAAGTGEMMTVYELARSLTGQMSLGDAADIMVKHLRRLVPVSLSVIYTYDHQTDELVATHASGDHAEIITGLRIPLGQRLAGWVGANRRTSVNSDPGRDLGEMVRSLLPRPRSCLSTPLVVGRDLVGVLGLYSPLRDAFSDDHRRIVEAVAVEVAKAVHHVPANQGSPVRTTGDAQYALPDIDQVLKLFAKEFGAPHLRAGPSVLLVHVDGGYGEGTASTASKRVAAILSESLRGADGVYKAGADEFVALLPEADSQSAEVIAERIRRSVATKLIDLCQRGVAVRITIATAPGDGHTLPELLQAARSVAERRDRSRRGPADLHAVH